MDRSKFLGGSDAAGVLGLSRWDTPLSIWAEKTGQFIRPEVESEAAELGKELEDYVAKRFERKTGLKAVRSSATVFHEKYGYLGANVDRLIEGEDAGLECKTASAWKSKEWEGEEIPQEYLIQCHHYMMVTGKARWHIAVLIGNQDFKWKLIERDEKMIAEMLRREVDFWENYVAPVVMPLQITKYDEPILSGLFPVANEGKSIALPDEVNIIIENLTAYKQDAKNIDGLIEQAENELKAHLAEAESGATSLYKVSWKNMVTRRFDQKAFDMAYPELSKQFKPAKTTRRFDYKPLKETHHG